MFDLAVEQDWMDEWMEEGRLLITKGWQSNWNHVTAKLHALNIWNYKGVLKRLCGYKESKVKPHD